MKRLIAAFLAWAMLATPAPAQLLFFGVGPGARAAAGGVSRVGNPTYAAAASIALKNYAYPTGTTTGTLLCIYIVNNNGTTPTVIFHGDLTVISQSGSTNTFTNQTNYKSYLFSAVVPSADATGGIDVTGVAQDLPTTIVAYTGATGCFQAGFSESALAATASTSLSVTATGASEGQLAFVMQRTNSPVAVTVTQPAAGDFTHWNQGNNSTFTGGTCCFIFEIADSLTGYVNGAHQWTGFVSGTGVIAVQQVELR